MKWTYCTVTKWKRLTKRKLKFNPRAENNVFSSKKTKTSESNEGLAKLSKQRSIQELIPSIRQARQAPMATICAVVVATVSRRMCIFSVLGEPCYIDPIRRFLHPAKHFAQHHPGHGRPRRVPQPKVWLCLAGARLQWLVPLPSAGEI